MAGMAPASVFVVEHLHVHANGEEEVKMIGVYESREAAVGAVPNGYKSGFYVEEYEIGKDHWSEGYDNLIP